MREADLFPPLKQYFQAQGFVVYAEVPAPHGGYVDLLAVREQITAAVEMKLRFSREAVRQAARNKHFVWQSFVAVPASAELPKARRASAKRNRSGLLLVSPSRVEVAVAAPVSAPPNSVREAFGPLLEGEIGAVYAAAAGGVPTAKRVSIFRILIEKVEAALRARGGLANTDQLLADTLAWNYFDGKRAGLAWILRNRFRALDADLWALPGRRRTVAPACHRLDARALVRTHLPGTFVCVPRPDVVPAVGDWVELMRDGVPVERSRVISCERHLVVETPQRELRAGNAVFFPFRCPPGVPIPSETLVLRLAGVGHACPPAR